MSTPSLRKLRKRGVAGAEIVDGDAAAEIFDAREAARLVTPSMAALSVISTIRRSAMPARVRPPIGIVVEAGETLTLACNVGAAIGLLTTSSSTR
jgi:hypothetical protein